MHAQYAYILFSNQLLVKQVKDFNIDRIVFLFYLKFKQ